MAAVAVVILSLTTFHAANSPSGVQDSICLLIPAECGKRKRSICIYHHEMLGCISPLLMLESLFLFLTSVHVIPSIFGEISSSSLPQRIIDPN